MTPSRSADTTNAQVFRIVLHTVLTSGSIVVLSLALLPGMVLSVGANVLALWSLMAGKREQDQLITKIKELTGEVASLQADRDTILQEAEQRLEETKIEYICVQESTKAQYKELIAELKAQHGTRLSELDAQLAGLRSDYSCRLQAKDLKLEAIEASRQQLVEEYEQAKQQLMDEYTQAKKAVKAEHAQTLKSTKTQYEKQVQALKGNYQKQLKSVKTTLSELTAQVQTLHEQMSGVTTVPLAKGKAGNAALAVIDGILSERPTGPLSAAQETRQRSIGARAIYPSTAIAAATKEGLVNHQTRQG